MRFQNHQDTAHLPGGRVDVPGLLYGSLGLALSLALYWIGVFKRADAWLLDMLHKSLFQSGAPELPSPLFIILIAALFCFGIAFAVLDSASLWRRVVLGITAVVLTFAMVPTWAVWNIYFSPFVQAIAVFWSWFCVVIYAEHHQMPCELRDYGSPISSTKTQPFDSTNKTDTGSAVIGNQTEVKKLIETPEEKYKPKSEKKPETENVSDQKKIATSKKSTRRRRSNKTKKRK